MKLKEMKQKIADNKEQIKLYAILGAGFTLYAGLIVISVKRANAYNAQIEAQRKKLTDAINRGSTILPNTDGSFWILDPTG